MLDKTSLPVIERLNKVEKQRIYFLYQLQQFESPKKIYTMLDLSSQEAARIKHREGILNK